MNKMAYEFTEQQKNKIIGNWGNDFYGKILRIIEIYSDKWKLFDFELLKTYDKNMLLHIDIYGANIVSGGNGGYKLIDPKGVIGDPVFETVRFISYYASRYGAGDFDVERIEFAWNVLNDKK